MSKHRFCEFIFDFVELVNLLNAVPVWPVEENNSDMFQYLKMFS